MKKLINKIGIITFSFSLIIAIASIPSSSPTSASPQYKLSQSFQTKLKKSFKNSKWASQTKSNSGSNITNGQSGTIFEDSRSNLWSMGYGTKLQKYNYATKRWIEETSDNSGSNIIDGQGGTIFEDSRGNLWSMGNKTPLQKYDYQTKSWTEEKIANSGSSIIDGFNGIIFEDSRGNLWSMGSGTKLQEYNCATKRWIKETSDNSGSNIIDGQGGTIFEDSRGNLWSMGNKTPLQKYDYQTKRWTTETIANSGSSIIDGFNGIIFEDSRGNLWSMGSGTKLQKYNYATKRWIQETSDNSGSSIINGLYGTIFEDSRGNLWSMGSGGASLQKYDYQTKRWIIQTRSNSGSNIVHNLGGNIFEDSRSNLWSMTQFKKLQKYDYLTKRWTEQTSANSGSNITNGLYGTIFEDSRGNLWSMGRRTLLQKLTPTKETNLDSQKVKDFDIEFKKISNKNSKIAISIKGYRQYTSSLFTHLRYKKKVESSWKVIKKRTMMLDATEYEFKWVLGTEETLASGQELPQKIIIKSNGAIGTTTFFQKIDIAKVKMFLSKLSNSNINSLATTNRLVSVATKEEVLKQIKLANGYNDLTSDQKALITKDSISLSEDTAGTLKVVITFEGETYELIKGGFNKLSLKAEANKFQDFISTDTIKSNAASLKVSPKNVLNVFKKISGYQRPSNLTSDIVITKAIVKEALNPQTRKLIFELTISRQDEVVKKNVIVTFKKGSSELSTGAIVGISLGSVFGIGIISFLIFYLVKRNKK